MCMARVLDCKWSPLSRATLLAGRSPAPQHSPYFLASALLPVILSFWVNGHFVNCIFSFVWCGQSCQWESVSSIFWSFQCFFFFGYSIFCQHIFMCMFFEAVMFIVFSFVCRLCDVVSDPFNIESVGPLTESIHMSSQWRNTHRKGVGNFWKIRVDATDTHIYSKFLSSQWKRGHIHTETNVLQINGVLRTPFYLFLFQFIFLSLNVSWGVNDKNSVPCRDNSRRKRAFARYRGLLPITSIPVVLSGPSFAC